jgi:hypothetical protein
MTQMTKRIVLKNKLERNSILPFIDKLEESIEDKNVLKEFIQDCGKELMGKLIKGESAPKIIEKYCSATIEDMRKKIDKWKKAQIAK